MQEHINIQPETELFPLPELQQMTAEDAIAENLSDYILFLPCQAIECPLGADSSHFLEVWAAPTEPQTPRTTQHPLLPIYYPSPLRLLLSFYSCLSQADSLIKFVS